MELNDFTEKIRESGIEINDEQASLIFNELSQNGYTVSDKGESTFVLTWVDQSGEMEKKVTMDQMIIFAADQKYKETVNIMNQLDEIITITLDNLPAYCENLSNLIKKEKELHLVEDVLVQTEHFNQLKKITDIIPEKSRKVSR